MGAVWKANPPPPPPPPPLLGLLELELSSGAFKISTAISDYSKYVGLNNYNTNNKNYLVQKDYDSSNEQYFMWTFEKIPHWESMLTIMLLFKLILVNGFCLILSTQ